MKQLSFNFVFIVEKFYECISFVPLFHSDVFLA